MAYERPDPFRREPGGPFDSLERERFAVARAKGMAIKASATEAGVSATAGYAFERHDAMRLRVRELRAGAETYVGVSMGWLLTQLKRNALKARKAGAFKASNEALSLIAKIVQRQPELTKDQARSLPPDVTHEDVHTALTRRFHARARGAELVPIEARGVEVSRVTEADEPDPPDHDEREAAQ